jgi:serine/threonine protein kinase
MNNAWTFGKYEVVDRVGEGAFGTVFKGRNRKTGEDVVIKVERLDTASPSLKHETTLLNWLYSKSCRHISPVYWYGVVAPHRALVMPLYQRSLQQYVHDAAGSPVDLDAVRSILRAAVLILKDVHGRGVVHRDIKPGNWMIQGDQLVLIDFGLAAFYVDEHESHVPPAVPLHEHVIGTPKFLSWHVHCGHTPSRRDDLISLGYVGLYLVTGGALFHRNAGAAPASLLPATHVDSPLNRWMKEQKAWDRLATQWLPANPCRALTQFLRETYTLGFPERPSYERYAAWFQESDGDDNAPT